MPKRSKDKMSEPITVIGTKTMISGNLEGDEDLTVEGHVEGSINLSKTLTVEVGGVVRANINVRNAIISGVLVGNVEAQEAVHITENGRVVGDITSPRVILVDGSSFRGSIDMGDFNIETTPGETRRSTAVTKHLEEGDEEEAPARSAPTRVRMAPAAHRPAARPASPRPSRAPAKRIASAKKKPPAPKVRSVGKTKGKKKR
jgi:cytoskeletal protein CcmA (bactofilin family)